MQPVLQSWVEQLRMPEYSRIAIYLYSPEVRKRNTRAERRRTVRGLQPKPRRRMQRDMPSRAWMVLQQPRLLPTVRQQSGRLRLPGRMRWRQYSKWWWMQCLLPGRTRLRLPNYHLRQLAVQVDLRQCSSGRQWGMWRRRQPERRRMLQQLPSRTPVELFDKPRRQIGVFLEDHRFLQERYLRAWRRTWRVRRRQQPEYRRVHQQLPSRPQLRVPECPRPKDYLRSPRNHRR